MPRRIPAGKGLARVGKGWQGLARVGKGWQVIGMWRAGEKEKRIAAHLNILQGAISKLINRYRQGQQLSPGVNTGRSKKISSQDDRLLYRTCRQDCFRSANTLSGEWQERINSRISRQIVNRRLLSPGLRGRRPATKPLLTR